jgi:lipopolysaccharide exporter
MFTQYRMSFLTLSASSLVAQAISVLSLIAVSRLYGPENFSLLVLYSNLLIWLGPIVCLKYDIAIVVSEDASEAANLVVLSIFISLIIALLAFAVALLNSYFGFLDDFSNNMLIWVILAPTGILLTGANASLRSYLHYYKEYLNFSTTPIIFSTVYGLLAITLYNVWPTGTTLVISQIIATLSVCVFILLKLKSKKYLREKIKIESILIAGRKNIGYPIFSAPGSLVDGLSQAMPIYFIAFIFNNLVIASYGLVLKIVVVPMRFIFSSISTLMLKIIHDEIADGHAVKIFWYISSGLLIFIIIATLILVNWASTVIRLFLGEEWAQTGLIVETMCFALLFSAAVSSLSNIFAATKRLGLGAAWQVLYFILSLIFFMLIFLDENLTQELFFELLAIKEVSLYAVYFLMIAFSVHKPKVK